jgi:hypothetical protein
MARIVTINWTTTSVPVPGVFTPGNYRVTLGSESQDVPVSPAVFELPASFVGGVYEATIQLLDTLGQARGSAATVAVTVPEQSTMINAPINATAVVVLG